jgi:hypothetical protein
VKQTYNKNLKKKKKEEEERERKKGERYIVNVVRLVESWVDSIG